MLLSDLCRKINVSSAEILASQRLSEHEKYLQLFKHVQESDILVAECFDDWRRSNLWIKLVKICKHKLLSEEHLGNLSEESRARLQLLFPTAK